MWLEVAQVPLEVRAIGDMVNSAKLSQVAPTTKLATVARRTVARVGGQGQQGAVALVAVACSFWGVCYDDKARTGHVLGWALWRLRAAGEGRRRSVNWVCFISCARAPSREKLTMTSCSLLTESRPLQAAEEHCMASWQSMA